MKNEAFITFQQDALWFHFTYIRGMNKQFFFFGYVTRIHARGWLIVPEVPRKIGPSLIAFRVRKLRHNGNRGVGVERGGDYVYANRNVRAVTHS